MQTAEKFRWLIFWAITAVNLLLCAVSFWTSKLGLDTTTDSGLVSSSVAFAGAAFAFVFWFSLSRRFPEVSAQKKVGYFAVVTVVGVMLFGFSTQWSVITLGGREAVSLHMQVVLSESDKQGLALLRQGSEEANLAPNFVSLADQFEGYASREAKGAFSGLSGEGDVVATLRNTAETFRGLSQSVKETERERQQMYEDLKRNIADARDILSDEQKHLRVANLQFGKKLAEINELMTRMSETTSMKFINTVNRNLSSLTVVVTEKTSKKQREAIERLKGMVEAAQDIIKQITSQDELAEVEIQTFTMISMSKAVLQYAGDIFYAWAYALALDFAPFLFIVMLAMARQEEEKEITLEEARKIKLDAEGAVKVILSDARDRIFEIVEEAKPVFSGMVDQARDELEALKPHITNTADAAQAALEKASTGVVDAMRAAVANAKKEVELAGAEQLRQLKEVKFKI